MRKKILAWFKADVMRFVIIVVLVLLLIAVSIIAIQGDPTIQQIEDLKEEFRSIGVRYFVEAAYVESVVMVDIDDKTEFKLLIRKYQPEILYYYKSGFGMMKYVRFTFFEDETKRQIAYRWDHDF